MEDTYTHKDLANLCTVSETTIKSYRRKFPGFIPVLTRGKPIRFKKEAGDVCLMIRDCFEKGMSVRETSKVLGEHFKEVPVKRQQTSKEALPQGHSRGIVSEAYMEKFFETAGQMMHGMASLATAQAKASQRLSKLESTVSTLIEIETHNADLFTKMISRMDGTPQPAVHAEPTPPPEAEKKGETQCETKVRARKIVNVTDNTGKVESYAIEKEEVEVPIRPSDDFLDTPIVIMNDQGEFLGVPGRLALTGFIEILLRDAEEQGISRAHWVRENENWVLNMDAAGGYTHDLYFMSTTTPRGNLVVLFDRLDVNGKETSQQFLQEFFKQVKDRV
jgi:hypothetical protein